MTFRPSKKLLHPRNPSKMSDASDLKQIEGLMEQEGKQSQRLDPTENPLRQTRDVFGRPKVDPYKKLLKTRIR